MEQQPCWVAAVIRDETGNVLLVRSGDDQAWDLPSGTLSRGEDVVAAVRRVVAESATIGVSVGWLAGIHSTVHDGLTLVFLARHAAGRVAPAGRTRTCRWVSPADAARILWPARAEQLRGALEARQPQPVTVVSPPGLPRRTALTGVAGLT